MLSLSGARSSLTNGRFLKATCEPECWFAGIYTAGRKTCGLCSARMIRFEPKSLCIPSLLVILIVSFLHRNILEIKSAVPFDLLYAFEPWRGQASTSSAHRNPELLD